MPTIRAPPITHPDAVSLAHYDGRLGSDEMPHQPQLMAKYLVAQGPVEEAARMDCEARIHQRSEARQCRARNHCGNSWYRPQKCVILWI